LTEFFYRCFLDQKQAQSPNLNSQQSVRFRTRFPKPQPNIGASSGLERNRRLSGHYHSSGSISESTATLDHLRTPPVTPQTVDPYGSHAAAASPYRFMDQIPSPKVIGSEMAMSPMRRTISSSVYHHADATILNNQTNSNYKQFIITNHSSGHMVTHSPAQQIVSFSQPATPYTPIGSVYNARFPKEQIKNVIKHLAMQKLKKIESEVTYTKM
jgi:hypothetical protein